MESDRKLHLGFCLVLTADDVRFAVLSDDAKAIAKAPGIGMKTAKKLILESKDKFTLEEAFEKKLENGASGAEPGAVVESDAKTEAVQALTALGYANSDALQCGASGGDHGGHGYRDDTEAGIKAAGFSVRRNYGQRTKNYYDRCHGGRRPD